MIDIIDLCFGYKKDNPLFQHLHLHLEKGHIYGLFGKNGAGKSTLLKNMTGLTFPNKGKCLFNGTDVSKRSIAILSEIFFLPEQLFVPSLTCLQFASYTGSFYPKFSRQDYIQYLNALDVDPNAVMDQQSFGQQKKAMIAFGLATNTSLLILDEPTNGLDIPSKVQFRKLMASCLSEDRCFIISTHQVRDLESLIDIVLILHNREIVVNHSLDDIIQNLSFGIYQHSEDLPVLYQEENIRGKSVILRNTTGHYSKVDLELLFNAAISGNSNVSDLLKQKFKGVKHDV